MGFVPAATQIKIVSALHLAVSYHLIFQPVLLEKQQIIILIGQAMGVDRQLVFSSPESRPITSFLGLMFALTAISDLVAAGIDGIPFYIHWGGQAPIRVTFFFVLATLVYVFDAKPTANATWITGGLLSVKTSWVFCWAFMEIIAWFSIYSSVREEKQNIFIERERVAAE